MNFGYLLLPGRIFTKDIFTTDREVRKVVKRERIPVGCVPSAVVAISRRGGVCLEGSVYLAGGSAWGWRCLANGGLPGGGGGVCLGGSAWLGSAWGISAWGCLPGDGGACLGGVCLGQCLPRGSAWGSA